MEPFPDHIVSFSLERLLETIRHAPSGLVLLDAHDDHGLRTVSDGLAALLGYSREDLVSLRLRDLVHPDDPGVGERLAELRAGERESFQCECRYRHRDGHYIWLLVSFAMLRDPDGSALYLLGHLSDVNADKRNQEELRRSVQLHQTLTQNLPKTTVALVDRDRRVLAVEGEGERMLRNSTMVGKRVDDLNYLPPDRLARLVGKVEAALSGERWEYHSELGDTVLHITVSPLYDDGGEPYAAMIVSRDVTIEHRARQQLHRLAWFDSLTDLPNRHAFRERLDSVLGDGVEPTLIFLDVDNFKQVNDSLGHDAGDELLRRLAERVRGCVRDSDEVFRLSGDEFTVILGSTGAVEPVAAVAKRILDAVAMPVVIAGHELFPTASLGIARASGPAGAGSELLKAADMAMYAAKRDGRNTFRFFHESMAAAAEEQLRLSSDLHRAIERGELVLHYLPQFSLADERVVSVEALVRWNHPHRGLVAPLDFIPLAEETGLIVPVGTWVLHEACRQLALWRAGGHHDLRVAVNVAAPQLLLGDLAGTVAAALHSAGLPGPAIELEITESALMDADRADRVLSSLRQMGVRLAIDDFGTGYSSLSRLRGLPLDTLKIDRAFVADVPSSPDAAALVRSIVALADSLGLSTLAEGVETEGQRDYLLEQGCAMAAGWLWSRALPAEELTDQLGRRAARLSRT